MKVNLALYLLRLIIVSSSVGQGGLVSLSEFRKSNKIPTATFHRHINSLIDHGFIVRISRDVYTLKSEFLDHAMMAKHQLPLSAEFDQTKWEGFPF